MLKGIQWKLIIFVFFVQFLLAVSVRADVYILNYSGGEESYSPITLPGEELTTIAAGTTTQTMWVVGIGTSDDGPVELEEPAPLFSISVTPSCVTCPAIFFGGTSSCESIRVTNTGNVAVGLLVKVNNYAFSVEQPSIPLSAGDITNLGVEFSPQPFTTGEVRGKVIITAYKDTQFQSHEVELTGTSYFLIIIAVSVIAFFAWYMLRRIRG